MRFKKLVSSAALSLTVVVLMNGNLFGQSLEPLNPPRQNQSRSNQSRSLQPLATVQGAAIKSPSPYKLTSRFHLQKGSDEGYLVVKIELPKGSYIYSMTQAAPPRPSRIEVTPSAQFRLVGDFSPDRPATIIENDPVFKQRLEKHVDGVQFFVPIKIAPQADIAKLSAEIAYSGQVCTEQGTCMPIAGVKIEGKFAGYFERKAQERTASRNQATQSNPIR